MTQIMEQIMEKIKEFNKDFANVGTDQNNMLKIIHFTCKDKNNINNDIWKRCLHEYKTMYPDYKIIIYDNNNLKTSLYLNIH